MKSKTKKSAEAEWAMQLVRERMKESQAIAHLGFDMEMVEKGRAVFQRTDVSSEDDIKALIARAVKEYGRLDIT